MILGGVCGVLTLIGGAGLLWRRLTNQRAGDIHYTRYYHHEHFAHSVPACLEHYSVFGAISGWYKRNDEVGGLAQSIVTRGGSLEMLSGVAFVFRVHLRWE